MLYFVKASEGPLIGSKAMATLPILIVHAIIVNCLYSCFLLLFPRLEHPIGWICARYKSVLLLLFIINIDHVAVIKHEYKQFTVIAKTKLCTEIHV